MATSALDAAQAASHHRQELVALYHQRLRTLLLPQRLDDDAFDAISHHINSASLRRLRERNKSIDARVDGTPECVPERPCTGRQGVSSQFISTAASRSAPSHEDLFLDQTPKPVVYESTLYRVYKTVTGPKIGIMGVDVAYIWLILGMVAAYLICRYLQHSVRKHHSEMSRRRHQVVALMVPLARADCAPDSNYIFRRPQKTGLGPVPNYRRRMVLPEDAKAAIDASHSAWAEMTLPLLDDTSAASATPRGEWSHACGLEHVTFYHSSILLPILRRLQTPALRAAFRKSLCASGALDANRTASGAGENAPTSIASIGTNLKRLLTGSSFGSSGNESSSRTPDGHSVQGHVSAVYHRTTNVTCRLTDLDLQDWSKSHALGLAQTRKYIASLRALRAHGVDTERIAREFATVPHGTQTSPAAQSAHHAAYSDFMLKIDSAAAGVPHSALTSNALQTAVVALKRACEARPYNQAEWWRR